MMKWALLALAFSVIPIPQPKPAQMCALHCTASEEGLQLIRAFEGYMPLPYKDAVGIPTVGFGHVIRAHDTLTLPLLPADADALLQKDVEQVQREMRRLVDVPLHQNQCDALTSFTFNLGSGALGKSTLLKRVNEPAHEKVPPEFRRWVYAGGRKLRGLIARREAEVALYAKTQN